MVDTVPIVRASNGVSYSQDANKQAAITMKKKKKTEPEAAVLKKPNRMEKNDKNRPKKTETNPKLSLSKLTISVYWRACRQALFK